MGRNLCAIALKEVKSLFLSPIAYTVFVVALIINGFAFYLLTGYYSTPTTSPMGSVMEMFFGGTFFYWFLMMLVVPVITMRTFAEEKRSGTIETLMTAPVSDAEVVLGKFLGVFVFFMALWLPVAFYCLYLKRYGGLDWGEVLTGIVGTLLMGGALLAMGVFSSTLSRNQVVAAVISFGIILALFSTGFLDIVIKGGKAAKVANYISFLDRFRAFSQGIFDTRDIVYYLGLLVFFLFLSIRSLETRKWR